MDASRVRTTNCNNSILPWPCVYMASIASHYKAVSVIVHVPLPPNVIAHVLLPPNVIVHVQALGSSCKALPENCGFSPPKWPFPFPNNADFGSWRDFGGPVRGETVTVFRLDVLL